VTEPDILPVLLCGQIVVLCGWRIWLCDIGMGATSMLLIKICWPWVFANPVQWAHNQVVNVDAARRKTLPLDCAVIPSLPDGLPTLRTVLCRR